jgi:hypothetical protein
MKARAAAATGVARFSRKVPENDSTWSTFNALATISHHESLMKVLLALVRSSPDFHCEHSSIALF